MRNTAALGLLIAVLAPEPAAAAAGDTGDCLSIADPEARLRCYDARLGYDPEADDASDAQVPARSSEPASTPSSTPSSTPRPSASRDRPPAPADRAAPEGAGAERPATSGDPVRSVEPETIEARVVEVLTTSLGRTRLRLDNGETWEYSRIDRTPAPEAGTRVAIREGAFGSHHLRPVDGSARSHKVRRVR